VEVVASADAVDSSVVEVLGAVALVVADISAAEVQWLAAVTDAAEQEPGRVDTVVVRLGNEVVVAAVVVVAVVAAVVVAAVVAAEPVEPFEPPAFSSFSSQCYEPAVADAASMSRRRCIPRMTLRIGKETLLIALPSVAAFSANLGAHWAFVASINAH